MTPAARKALEAAQQKRTGTAPKDYERAFLAGLRFAAQICRDRANGIEKMALPHSYLHMRVMELRQLADAIEQQAEGT